MDRDGDKARHGIVKGNKRIFQCLIIVATCSLLVVAVYAWWPSVSSREVETVTMEVDQPPILYIRDSDSEDMAQLDLKDLTIGVDKNLIFCVSSKSSISAGETSITEKTMPFSLELCYTNNLGATYRLKEAEYIGETADNPDAPDIVQYTSQKGTPYYYRLGDELAGTNKSDDGNSRVYGDNFSESNNLADYYIYDFLADSSSPNNTLQFINNNSGDDLKYGLANTYFCRFFVLNISWASGVVPAYVDPKETDLIYVIARGVTGEE